MPAALISAVVLFGAAAFLFCADGWEESLGREVPPDPAGDGADSEEAAAAESPATRQFAWWHGLVAVGLFLGLQVAGGVCWALIAGVARINFFNVLALLAIAACVDGFLALVIFAVAWFLYRDLARGLGLRMPGHIFHWLWVPVGVVVMFLFAVGYDEFLNKFGLDMEQELTEPLRRLEGLSSWAVVMLTAGVIVPVGEEVLFRGCMYAGFRKNLGAFWAVVLSSAAFAAVHFDLDALPPLFLMGVVAAVSYEKTRCLFVPICIHAINNIITLSIIATN
ncbi:MAG: lysostaphin resistance A-like protein [Planctomycetota bacterium]|jgi:membrane protease YdiL (CAAX protease family)